MKTDRADRLIVAGGTTGKVSTTPDPFLTDVTLAPQGTAYTSDFTHPVLCHITAPGSRVR
ncbi:hypothetical protein [Streptomyces sviceus]|uniref:hypothetical protein n=1 Tax=Streptomyces sviceus TaxID=285530 RepID=UPI0036EB09BF